MVALLLAVAAGLCWGIGEFFTKQVLHTKSVGPITAIAVRSTVALPLIWCAYFIAVHVLKSEPADWFRRAGAPTLTKLVLGSGVVAGALAMICFYSALKLDDISRIKPIAFTIAPALAALLGWLVLKESMSTQKAVAIGLILAGVVLLTGAPGKTNGSAGSAAERDAGGDGGDGAGQRP